MATSQNAQKKTLKKTLETKHSMFDIPGFPDKNITTEKIVITILTALGAWGGFPAPPKAFNRLVTNEVVQYLLVFVLLMQGGTGGNYKLAGLATGIMYVLHKVLDN